MVALAIGNLFLHKPISAVCDALYYRMGRVAYERTTMLAIAAASAAGTLFLLRRRLRSLWNLPVALGLVAIAAASVVAQQWLLVSNIELIHYPQFALLAVLLIGAGLGPRAAWLAATLAGVLDETYQWRVIYANVPGTYFDWNDIVLNAIGATWTVLLAAAVGVRDSPSGPGVRRLLRGLLAGLLVALGVLLWLAPPGVVATDRFPYVRPAMARAATGLDYHVMPASEGLAALLLLAALVWPSTRQLGRPLAASLQAALVIGLGLGGCVGHGGTAAQSLVPPAQLDGAEAGEEDAVGVSPRAAPGRDFIVTFWCGPPLAELSDARAAEIAAAGFNVIGAPCEGAVDPGLNRQALDVAARHGLTLWITDRRLNASLPLEPDWNARLSEIVASYRDHPALGGYFVVDEPSAEQFGELADLVAALRTVDPDRLAYINLLPDFAPPEALGTESYRAHVEQFVDLVQPAILSFDYYPFKDGFDRATFFDNLLLVRAVAQEHGLPFLLIVQAMPHGRYRDPTAAELAWQVNHALAFGARGISYFAYWTPVHVDAAERLQFHRGLIEQGRPTEHLSQAAAINRDVRAYAAELDGFASLAVADSRGTFGAPLPLGPLAGLDGGPATVGLFARPGALAMVLVNQDYRHARRITLRMQADVRLPERFDVKSERWCRLRNPTLALPAGGAQLLRWAASSLVAGEPPPRPPLPPPRCSSARRRVP